MKDVSLGKALTMIGAKVGQPLPPPDRITRNCTVLEYSTPWGGVMLIDADGDPNNRRAYIIDPQKAHARLTSYVTREADLDSISATVEPVKPVEMVYSFRQAVNPGKTATCTRIISRDDDGIFITAGRALLIHEYTTAPRAALVSILAGFKLLAGNHDITLNIPDSRIRTNFNEHMERWIKTNWRGSGGTRVKNTDLWQPIHVEMQKHKVTVLESPGHYLEQMCSVDAQEHLTLHVDNPNAESGGN